MKGMDRRVPKQEPQKLKEEQGSLDFGLFNLDDIQFLMKGDYKEYTPEQMVFLEKCLLENGNKQFHRTLIRYKELKEKHEKIEQEERRRSRFRFGKPY